MVNVQCNQKRDVNETSDENSLHHNDNNRH